MSVVLKLKTSDITLGAPMFLAHGDADKKKLVCIRLNIVDANINYWGYLINIPDRQVILKEKLMLVAALEGMKYDKQLNKESVK